MAYKPLAIGVDDFQELITKEYYYVDKSLMIKELLDRKGKVNLFTRPRRFGKTLNLSMIRYYFELPEDGECRKELFSGLKIQKAGSEYTAFQEQYPVIMLTLKSAKQPTWDMAYASLVDDIAREYSRHSKILSSKDISGADKDRFVKIRDRVAEKIDYAKSLLFLSQCLEQCYGKKVIILIDEYDVPLENAHYEGFYEDMVMFIRSLFESALKTNPYLEFSVITGCLRISKESIFTGLNNLEIISILNKDYDEYFGFVESEVGHMLEVYQCQDKMDVIRQWYDGYLFGDTKVYNPWSVINFVKRLCSDKEAFPTAVWSNTSSNSIIRDLVYRADTLVQDEIESLVCGASIEKKVHEDITYEDIYKSEDNLWNFLFFTGYLKQISIRMDGVNRYITMAIPNNELLYIYENTIETWFREKIQMEDLTMLYQSMLDGQVEIFQQEVERELRKTISYMDSAEAFYHGFLLGLMANLKGYRIKSNREAGDGRYDICIYSLNVDLPPIILELKLAGKYRELELACERALNQIEELNYCEVFEEEGYGEVICYGVGFYKKQIKVRMKRKKIC